jgi:hypothetical protein
MQSYLAFRVLAKTCKVSDPGFTTLRARYQAMLSTSSMTENTILRGLWKQIQFLGAGELTLNRHNDVYSSKERYSS